MLKSRSIVTVLLLASLLLALVGQSCKTTEIRINNLRCEYMHTPIGIDVATPRFTWNYEAVSGHDFKQGSVQLLISKNQDALSDKASNDVWRSKVVSSEEPFIIAEPAYVLEPHTTYYWKVIVRDDNNSREIASPISQFETAFMQPSNWQAQWISDNENTDTPRAPMLRKTFEISDNKQIEKARLYISAAGYYDVSINGNPIDTSVFLAPGYTHYDKRNLYNTYDVTPLVQSGKNVITSILGNGFYNAFAPVATWSFEQARWRNRASMIGELHITYTDNTKDIIVSDSTWKVSSSGPYVQNNIYSGDTYDTNKEIAGWDKPTFDDSSWPQATIMKSPSEHLVAEREPVIRKVKSIEPISVKSFGDTVFVYDFGVNMTGTCQLKIEGEKNTRVEMQYGELLKPNGRIEMRNLDIYYKPLPELAFQTDVLFLNGKEHIFTPKFSYKGFQYVEVRSNRPIKQDKINITALNFHSDLKKVGHFSCSNDLLNQIWEAANRSYLSNVMSISTPIVFRYKCIELGNKKKIHWRPKCNMAQFETLLT